MHQSLISFVKIRETENKREGFTGSYKHVNGFQSIKKEVIFGIEIMKVGIYSLCNNKKSLIFRSCN